jgi:hypothetical protein
MKENKELLELRKKLIEQTNDNKQEEKCQEA